MLSFFRNFYPYNKKNLTEIDLETSNEIFIPILNCNKEEFLFRFDISLLCQMFNINPEHFIFWDDIFLKEFFEKNKENGKKYKLLNNF